MKNLFCLSLLIRQRAASSLLLALSIVPSSHSYSAPKILVVGVTGVGKSSFINSLINYTNFISKRTEEFKDTEFAPVGHGLQSKTDDITSYLLSLEDGSEVELWDTPGLLDTRGTDQRNIVSILDTLQRVGSYSKIIIGIKPTRVTKEIKNSLRDLYFMYRNCFLRGQISFVMMSSGLIGKRGIDPIKKSFKEIFSEIFSDIDLEPIPIFHVENNLAAPEKLQLIKSDGRSRVSSPNAIDQDTMNNIAMILEWLGDTSDEILVQGQLFLLTHTLDRLRYDRLQSLKALANNMLDTISVFDRELYDLFFKINSRELDEQALARKFQFLKQKMDLINSYKSKDQQKIDEINMEMAMVEEQMRALVMEIEEIKETNSVIWHIQDKIKIYKSLRQRFEDNYCDIPLLNREYFTIDELRSVIALVTSSIQ